MEYALALWIHDCKKNTALDINIIHEKDRQLYGKFTDGSDDDPDDPEPGPFMASPTKPTEFNASKGWFDKFQRNLMSVAMHEEDASADKLATEKYMNENSKTIIKEEGYLHEQVFNMVETCLFWKWMQLRTYIMKEAKTPEFKAYKDSVTIIMCGSAAGFMIEPGLTCKSKNPKGLENKNMNLLPVHWIYNQKAWVTKQVTSDWFPQCFISKVKVNFAKKGLEFKVLFLMDNTEGHMFDLSYDYKNQILIIKHHITDPALVMILKHSLWKTPFNT